MIPNAPIKGMADPDRRVPGAGHRTPVNVSDAHKLSARLTVTDTALREDWSAKDMALILLVLGLDNESLGALAPIAIKEEWSRLQEVLNEYGA